MLPKANEEISLPTCKGPKGVNGMNNPAEKKPVFTSPIVGRETCALMSDSPINSDDGDNGEELVKIKIPECREGDVLQVYVSCDTDYTDGTALALFADGCKPSLAIARKAFLLKSFIGGIEIPENEKTTFVLSIINFYTVPVDGPVSFTVRFGRNPTAEKAKILSSSHNAIIVSHG